MSMNNEKNIYGMPNMGCLIGTAYQVLLGQLTTALKQAGLKISAPEYLVLRALYATDGMQQCEIGDLIGKDKSAICRTVAAMAKRGLVRTEPVSYKCLRVYLTDSSKEMRATIMDIACQRQEALERLCSDKELTVFNRVLHNIINQ